MSRAFTFEQLPTPLNEPETQLQFLLVWDSTRPIPYDAETIIHDVMQLARERLDNNLYTYRAARPEWRA
jgi:hypothetical protein